MYTALYLDTGCVIIFLYFDIYVGTGICTLLYRCIGIGIFFYLYTCVSTKRVSCYKCVTSCVFIPNLILPQVCWY